MNRFHKCPKAKILIAALALTWCMVPSLPADEAAVATAAWTATEVTFSGASDHELLLKVTGPSFAYMIRGRGSVIFRAEDEGRQPLPDGIYRYELIEIASGHDGETPANEPDRMLREQRERLMRREGRWPAPPRRLHDLFRIENTAIVPPADRPHAEAESAGQVDPERGHDHPHPHSEEGG